MTKAVVPQSPGVDLEKVLIKGDLAALTPPQRVQYYTQVCESLGLNPLTKPFDYIVLNGKLTLYAKKDAAEQLRKLHNVSITDLQITGDGNTFEALARAALPNGRTDADMGIVPIKGLTGDKLANAKLKAVTKAKRRVTLSICGLGFLDETEIEPIHDARPVVVTPEGAIVDHAPKSQSKPAPKEHAPFDLDDTVHIKGDHKDFLPKTDNKSTNGRKRPFDPDVVRVKFAEAVDDYMEKGWKPKDGDLGAVIHNLEMCFAGDPNSTINRHRVSNYMIGKPSSKDWIDAEIIPF